MRLIFSHLFARFFMQLGIFAFVALAKLTIGSSRSLQLEVAR